TTYAAGKDSPPRSRRSTQTSASRTCSQSTSTTPAPTTTRALTDTGTSASDTSALRRSAASRASRDSLTQRSCWRRRRTNLATTRATSPCYALSSKTNRSPQLTRDEKETHEMKLHPALLGLGLIVAAGLACNFSVGNVNNGNVAATNTNADNTGGASNSGNASASNTSGEAGGVRVEELHVAKDKDGDEVKT